MPNQVLNTESFNYNFKCICIAKIVNIFTKRCGASNKLFLRNVTCSFLGFIDNLKTFYKRNKKLSRCAIIELLVIMARKMRAKPSAIASYFTRIPRAIFT